MWLTDCAILPNIQGKVYLVQIVDFTTRSVMCTLSLTDNNKHVLKYSALRPVACNGRLFA